MSKPSTLFISQGNSSFPQPGAEFFCVSGKKAQFDDTFPKIHFDISIAIYALALYVLKENIIGFIYQMFLPRLGCRVLELLLLMQYFSKAVLEVLGTAESVGV